MADPAAADWGWWRERRLPGGPLHLDTAAAGRSSLATLAATAAHAEREATTGAYVAQEEAEPLLAQGRADLARLLGVPDGGVAFVPSAQAALDTLLAIWPLHEGEQLLLLLRPGLTAADLEAAAPVLAAACWAREVVVVPHPTRAALVRLVVVRYDVAAYPASAA